jgi:diguanylate cyclase
LHWVSQPIVEVISRILTYPTATGGDEAVAGRVRSEQINNIKRYLPSIMLANACNALVLVVALWASPQRQFAILWASTVLIFSLYYGVRNRRPSHTKPSYVSPRAITRAARNAMFLGALWAVLPLLFFSHSSPGGQIIITCLCAGMLAGGAFASASIPIVAIAFTAPIVVASAIAIGSSSDPAYLMVAVMMISYIAVLWRGVFVYASQIAKRVAEQVHVERKVRRDELTNLPNRLAFAEALERAFARLTRLGERFAVLYLDLNDFKAVNDFCGHAIGDKLLVQVGQRLKVCIRQIDLVARLSGDEFAVIVADAKDRDTTTSLASRIISSLDAPFLIDDAEVLTSACIGVAFAPTDGDSPEVLLKSADEALYDAKPKTTGAVRLYDSEHKDVARRGRRLERDLRSALRGHEFFLVYQPIFALDKDSIVGCEALLRWRHPTLGIKLPDEFIDMLEETGLINQTGDWIFLEACKTAVSWSANMRIAVNVSAIQLRHARILSSVVDALAVSGLPPERLEIEITETAVIDDSEQTLSNLNALRELGVRIALDDFGTGYSSLTYLRKVSPDSIKIDASFVREVMTNSHSRSIVKSLINLSRDLNINVVAEGVETAEQRHFLLRYHCAEGQGHFIGDPKSAGEIGTFLLNEGAAKIHAA